jgi:uncharacterized protein RhaS with RHS repeats
MDGKEIYITDTRYAYDENGKIRELILRSGMVTTYLWSYAGSLPVAKIEGASYREIDGLMSDSNADFISTLNQATRQSTIISMLEHLRNKLAEHLPGAVVATFTHKPLIGVVSMTDQNGLVSSFTYDEFQRLMATYDHQGDLVQSVDYHYAE